MKKFALIFLCLGLLFSFAACGKTDAPETQAPTPQLPEVTPEVTPAPTPTEPPAPAETPSIEYPILVPIGEIASVDLDMDGTEERLCVSLTEDEYGSMNVVLTLNGVDCTDALVYSDIYGEYIPFDNPDPDFYAITDLSGDDGCLELAIQDWGASDDYFTYFYRFAEGKLYSIGGAPGLIKSPWDGDTIRFDGQGKLSTIKRLRSLHTWFAYADYALNNDEKLELIPADLYEASYPTEVTVTGELLAYDRIDGSSFVLSIIRPPFVFLCVW